MHDDDLAYLAVTRLQRAYADLATRGAYDEVAALATPDARFTFTTSSGDVFQIEGARAFAEFSAKMIGRFSFFEYIPLNFVVTFDADGTARGRSYSLEVAEDGETKEWTQVYGVYEDEYARVDGDWRFARRHYRAYGVRTAGRLTAFGLPDAWTD